MHPDDLGPSRPILIGLTSPSTMVLTVNFDWTARTCLLYTSDAAWSDESLHAKMLFLVGPHALNKKNCQKYHVFVKK